MSIVVEHSTRIYPSHLNGEHVSIEPDTDGLDMVRVVYRDDEDNTRAEFTMSREVARAFFEEGLRLLDAGPLERRVTTLDERSKL